MAVVERIVSAVMYSYTGGKITMTTLYFNDSSSLELNEHWTFNVGKTYRITYTNGNPITVTAVTMQV